MEINYCRRCGSPLELVKEHIKVCGNGHTIYTNSSPASGLWIVNDKQEVLMAIRANEPGLGKYDSPGGFNDYNETYEDGITRELEEELGLSPSDYTKPEYLISSIDSYLYGGENISVMVAMFWARLKGNPDIKPQDDVADARFVPISTIDPKDIYFDAPRASFMVLKNTLGIV